MKLPEQKMQILFGLRVQFLALISVTIVCLLSQHQHIYPILFVSSIPLAQFYYHIKRMKFLHCQGSYFLFRDEKKSLPICPFVVNKISDQHWTCRYSRLQFWCSEFLLFFFLSLMRSYQFLVTVEIFSGVKALATWEVDPTACITGVSTSMYLILGKF